MTLNTLPKKAILAFIIAYCSVIWLTAWHEYGFTYRMTFPSTSSWLRDALIILLPVMLAVWMSTAVSQWLINRSRGNMSASNQSMLTAVIMGCLTTLSVILMESTRYFTTSIGNGAAIQLSLCNRIIPITNLILRTLLAIFPRTQALRIHVFLQDGFYLALINLGITVFLMMILEGLAALTTNRTYNREMA